MILYYIGKALELHGLSPKERSDRYITPENVGLIQRSFLCGML